MIGRAGNSQRGRREDCGIQSENSHDSLLVALATVWRLKPLGCIYAQMRSQPDLTHIKERDVDWIIIFVL